jgi:uncharacterized RDD family membrane protein YckC
LSTSPAVDVSSYEAPEWKQEISARVHAHRVRRQPVQPELTSEQMGRRTSLRAAGVAATVAERYAAALSYSEYLARLSSDAPMAAPPMYEEVSVEPASDFSHADYATAGSSALDLFQEQAAPALTIQFDEQPEAMPMAAAQVDLPPAPAQAPVDSFLEQVTVEPDVPLATKLIEFPRQLVAARRARPRLAEGPLLEPVAEATASADAAPQLRIFEVPEAETPAASISRTPLAAEAPVQAAEWHYIQLDTPLLSTALPEPVPQHETLPDVAPIERRLLAGAFDLGLVTLGFLGFAVSFIAVVSSAPSDKFTLIAAAAVFAGLFLGYQWLFLTLSDATPGMRYARIALCTFHDDNPTLRTRRGRIGATLLSAAAGGLGFAWMWFDHDGLTWHDRMTHTYQRCY